MFSYETAHTWSSIELTDQLILLKEEQRNRKRNSRNKEIKDYSLDIANTWSNKGLKVLLELEGPQTSIRMSKIHSE